MSERFQQILEIINEAKTFGARTLDDGTQLIGHVPHVAPEAWLHKVFPALDQSSITQLETHVLPHKIPATYRNFLTTCSNGLGLFSGSLALYGLRRNYVRTGDAVWQPYAIETPNTYERPRDASHSLFFIGGYDWDGSRLYLENEKTFRCARHSSKPLNEWSDFWEMLTSEVRRLSRLFDQQGRQKDPSVPTTPAN